MILNISTQEKVGHNTDPQRKPTIEDLSHSWGTPRKIVWVLFWNKV